MEKNVGKVDRIVRVVVGVAIIGAGVMNASWFGVIGAVIMLPALLGSDPIYTFVGVNTNRS